MAIVLDNSDGTHSITTSSTSFAYTCTGSNLLLLVTVGVDDSGTVDVSSITYNGVGLTNANANGNYNLQNKHSRIWYLINPATGSNTLAITLTGDPSDIAVIGVISLTGVHQTTPIDVAGGTTNANGTSLTKSLTAAATDEWQVSVVTEDTEALTASTNQTTRFTNTDSSFSRIAGGAKALAGSGSQAVVWTVASAVNYAMSVVFISPAATTST